MKNVPVHYKIGSGHKVQEDGQLNEDEDSNRALIDGKNTRSEKNEVDEANLSG